MSAFATGIVYVTHIETAEGKPNTKQITFVFPDKNDDPIEGKATMFVDGEKIQKPNEGQATYITGRIGLQQKTIILDASFFYPIPTDEDIKIPLSVAIVGSIEEIDDTSRKVVVKAKEYIAKQHISYNIVAHIPDNPRFKKTFEILRRGRAVFFTGKFLQMENDKIDVEVYRINYISDPTETMNPPEKRKAPWYMKETPSKNIKEEKNG